jgi:TonB family protein
MNSLFRSPNRGSRVFRIVQMLFAAMFIVFTISSAAQQPQLTLADILIGLRSKKATIEERNTILAGAVRERGITFMVTPEIEKELTATGAAKVLIDAVKEKSPAPAPAPTPAPTPTPDFAFYKTRADVSLGKGEYATALTDYDKAVSLKPDNAVAFLNRGKTYYNLKEYPKAGADFDKSIELDPKDSKAYYNRGLLNESLGELEKALADYQKAVDLDAANEPAKAMVKKITDQLQAKAAAEKPKVPEPVEKAQPPVKAPEYMSLGNLSAANAVRMVKPVYSTIAQRSNVEGKVVVEVELDIEGNVVTAKAVSGHQFLRSSAEDAARKSKFKPALFNGQPVKGTGVITYNFSLRPTNEE